MAFLSHTGQDNNTAALAGTIFKLLHDRNVPAFWDARSLGQNTGAHWERAIRACVAASRVVVVLLSGTFCKRFWCMHELDLALQQPQAGPKRKLMPVLLGMKWVDVVAQVDSYEADWRSFPQQEHVDVSRWRDNLLNQLLRYNLLLGRDEGWPGKESFHRLADRIADCVSNDIVPLALR